MTSLRSRLLVGLIGLFTVIGAVAGAVSYLLAMADANTSLDGQLRQIALNVGDTDFPAVARAADGVTLDPEDEFATIIWDASGSAHSSDLSFSGPRPSVAGYSHAISLGIDWRTYTRVDGSRTIEVAQQTVVRDELAAGAAARAILPIVALIPLSWLLVGFVVSRALRPLRGIVMELRQWGRRERRPLMLAALPTEILPLAAATNDLVVRLQAQVDFREQFISDAAHELRTPLTALSLQVRNLHNSGLPSQHVELVAEMRGGVQRMSAMVAKLLQLARADTNHSAPRAAVDLGDAIAASLQNVLPMAVEKTIDIGVAESSGETVLANADDLRVLIGNLVDNAVRYTPFGGAVDLAVRSNAGEVVLEVRDTGPGIPEHLLQQAFGRFVRLPGTPGDGSGLGLAIVRTIAERCGARVTLANRSDRPGLVARVAFSATGPNRTF